MLIPEILIQHVLAEGLKEARSDKKYLFQMFFNTPIDLVESFHKALCDHKLNMTMEFPRDNIELPLVWLNLMSEDEDMSFLQESMGWGFGADGKTLPDGKAYTDVGIHGGMFKDTSNLETGEADVLGGDSIFVGDAPHTDGSPFPAGERAESPDIVGEPARVYDVATENNKMPVFENIGQGYRANYVVTILGEGGTYVIFMYHLLKSIFNRYRNLLIANGMHNMSMSGTDFMGDPEILPSHVMSRAISLSFIYFSETIAKIATPVVAMGDADAQIEALEVGTSVVLDQFVLLSPQPTITEISPAVGAAGATVTITISGTNLNNGCYVEFSGTGITITYSDYIAGNRLRISVDIDVTATTGARDVTLTNPSGLSHTLTDGFTVT